MRTIKLNSCIAWFFSPQESRLSSWGVIHWWELRRIQFNLVIGIYALICFALFYWSVLTSGTLRPGEDAIEPIALIAAPIVINICFTLGWISEVSIRHFQPSVSPRLGPILLGTGLGSCLLVVSLPAVYWVGFRLLQMLHLLASTKNVSLCLVYPGHERLLHSAYSMYAQLFGMLWQCRGVILCMLLPMILLHYLYRWPYVGEKARYLELKYGIPDLRNWIFATIVYGGCAVVFLAVGIFICVRDATHGDFSYLDLIMFCISSLMSALAFAGWKVFRLKRHRGPGRWFTLQKAVREEGNSRMNDWRLTNQEKYLSGVKLRHMKYRPYSKNWEHDHCEFCMQKLSTRSGDLNQGYATEDEYRWICEGCYEDFKDMFKWEVSSE